MAIFVYATDFNVFKVQISRTKTNGDSCTNFILLENSIICSMMNDDPREVLALLNSLGFVGITAEQLKGFMKDLKLYRKAKERERQQRREEIKRKIIEKQQSTIKEVLREQNIFMGFRSTENTVSTDSSNSCADQSLVRVKVKCLSSDKENKETTNSNSSYIGTKQRLDILKPESKKESDHSNVKSISTSYNNENIRSQLMSKDKCLECLKEESLRVRKYSTKAYSDKIIHQEKPATPRTVRPMSAPNILERDQERVGSSQAKSISSIKTPHSGAKSFIRPWRLQPEVQKGLGVKKSDPVMLYQKYQQEWKQMSFPGEAKHASLRWAIREKMLGEDPHPLPLPRKSASMPILKKK